MFYTPFNPLICYWTMYLQAMNACMYPMVWAAM